MKTDMKRLSAAILLMLLSVAGSMQNAIAQDKNRAVSATALRTEGMTDPLGIDTQEPRLSWQLRSDKKNVRQLSYRILAATDTALLSLEKGDLWDSGIVASEQNLWIKYAGKPLGSNRHVYWKVKITAAYENGKTCESAWSRTACFSTGLLSENRWKGQWIGLDRVMAWDEETTHSRLSARYLRTEFQIQKEVKRATVFVSGLGLYELYINGKKIGDDVLTPAPTDYRRTVLYNTYDVTDALAADNAIGVTLGNGRYYTMRQHYKPYKITNFGYPKLRLNLIVEYTDGSRETIASDTRWKLTADGPIRSNNEYDGEIYDSRKELGDWTLPNYDDSKWETAQRVSLPEGTLRGNLLPNMKVLQEIKPETVRKSPNGFILDFGRNMAGWVEIRLRNTQAGDTVKLRFAERLTQSGDALYTENLRDALCTDLYICNGKENGTSWAPKFSYHGFRYVEISGCRLPANASVAEWFTAQTVSDEMEESGSFSCSDTLLNRIVNNARRGIQSNYKGMPIDCPQRNERQPWLGDRTMGCWGESYLFDNERLYAKWARDIGESQREDGCVPDVAPAFWNYYSDDVTWPCAWLFVCDMLYTQYGDMEPILRHYPAMKKWAAHIAEEYSDESGLIRKDKYGDWCVPPESPEMIHSQDPSRKTDGTLIASAYYHKVLQMLSRFARLQGFDEEAALYSQKAEAIKEAFNRRFLTVKTGTSPRPEHLLYPDSVYYGNNSVTSNILPLTFGMVPEAYRETVEKNIIASIITTHNAHVSCGVIGMQWLFRELCRIGRGDLAFLLAAQESYPSYGYMVKQGATTIWELWNGDTANPKMNSGNHVMLLGDLLPFCFECLSGIRSSDDKVAFKHIIFNPDFSIEELDSVNASYQTPYGVVSSRLIKSGIQTDWTISLPPNTTGEVHLPDGSVKQVGSGTYRFITDRATDKQVIENQFLYTHAPFPQAHAATIAETQKGDLVAAFFGGTHERHPDVCIYVCRKPKGAKTWTAPEKVADGIVNDTLRYACWNPVLFQTEGKKGDLLLFYKTGPNVAGWTGYLKRSSDGGKTWSEPEKMPDGLLGAVKNKPVSAGHRIVSPSSTESGGWKMHFEISDDGGKSWRKTAPTESDSSVLTADRLKKSPRRRPIYAIQPAILKLADGRLMAIGRSRNAKIAATYSSDNGDTWSRIQLTELPNNNSGIDAVTLSDGRHILVYNDFETIDGTPKGVRTPLRVAVSDDGEHWVNLLTLEDSPIGQYSYPSVIEGKDGTLHIVYTWRRERIKYQQIKLDKKK